MGFLLLFAALAIALLYEKTENKQKEKAYNDGICPKCGKRMWTITDEYGNDKEFGCTHCGHRTDRRYIGSDYNHLHKK